MAMRASSDIMLSLLFITLLQYSQVSPTSFSNDIDRRSFPDGFIFGAGSSAYQYEGASSDGGKGPSIWDTFTHKYPERIAGNGNGDVAIDFYHRYKGDVKILKEMGFDAFRFSISWSRILPSGKLSGGVNKQGIDFYNNLINELLVKGVEPFVTIFHWDTPQALENAYGGFLSDQIVDDFRDFAEVCFKEFGDRLKNWVTINEPYTYSAKGYDDGECAPGRCSAWVSTACQAGNSATEPYIVTHNLLLAHAAAVKLYKQKYQATQGGKIGITVTTLWMVPYSNTTSDREAASRALDFMLGWFMEPLTFGEYPSSMRTLVGERLPNFTTEQSEMVKGSFDFIGMNYYTAYYAVDVPSPNLVNISYSTDSLARLTGMRNGIPIGPQAGSSWLYVYPRGLRDLLIYTKEKYNDPIIYITENGVDEYNNDTLTVSEALEDPKRIDFFRNHLMFLHNAIREGVRVKGYFVWSLLDDFEWYAGYTVRFGFNLVDYTNNLKRYPKNSAIWLMKFLKEKTQYSDS